MLNSRTRTFGLSGSGFDVDSMVTKLMQTETAKVDKVKQQKQLLEWQKSSYRDFTNSLTALKNKYFNVTSSTNLFSSTSFNKTAVTTSDSSVVSVTGNSTAGVSTHTVTVNSIAKVGALAGSTVTVDPSTKLMADFTSLTTADTVLTIGSTSYKFNENETVSSFMTRVNNDSANSTYRLSYNSSGAKFVLTTKSTGVNTVAASGTFMTKAGFASTPITASGTDASFTLDGIEGYTSKTNKYTADGLTYNLLNAGTSNVSSTRDVDGIVKNIQEFVTAYNAIIDTINTKTTEKKYREYTPLTDDQKSAMEATDITQWEEKAKSGLLKSDSLLTGINDKLKSAMYSSYNLSDGSKMSLGDIGISTTSYTDKGKLTVDETKLRAALTENPDKVSELFTRQSGSYSSDGDNSARENSSGVLTKVSDILNDYVRTIRDTDGNKGLLLEKAGTINDASDTNNFVQKLISEKETLITTLTDKLADKQDYYYKKFTAMETAINNMNSQSSFLSSLSSNNSN